MSVYRDTFDNLAERKLVVRPLLGALHLRMDGLTAGGRLCVAMDLTWAQVEELRDQLTALLNVDEGAS